MKKYIKFSILSLSLVVFASCDLEAPTQSSLDPSVVYAQPGLTVNQIMAINDCWAYDRSYRNRQIFYSAANTDIEWYNTPSLKDGMSNLKYQACNYATTAGNDELNSASNIYTRLYGGIEQANVSINYIREYGNLNDPDMAHLLGEALTLRALIYLELIKNYSDVPGRFEPSSNENANIGRTNQDEIYKQLLADLAEAEEYCYWPNENSYTQSTERVSKAFVKGLRARVALYAGGYSLYSDGSYSLSSDEELSPAKMFTIARDECVSVIAKKCNELGTFEENFKSLCKDVTTAGKESLWEIPFTNNRGQVLYAKAPRQNFSQNQWTDNSEAGKTWGGGNGLLPTFYYDFDPEDIRRDITCIFYQWGDGTTGVAKQVPYSLKNVCQGKYRYEWMERKATTQDDGVNWQVMRLADVYMMAAEAENEIGSTAIAWNYLEPVLSRSLPADKVQALKTKYCASKEAFRNGIMEQRAFEFAGENIRKYDLIRWGVIDQKMAEAKIKLYQMANKEGVYADLPNKIYYVYDTDNITLKLYGLEHGQVDGDNSENKDIIMEALGVSNWEDVSSKGWIVSNDAPIITEDIIEGLYLKTPSTHCVWPIPQYVINLNNGLLNNDFLNY